MKRYALEVPLLERRAREWRSFAFNPDGVERGRFRKRKPHDCGRARCGLCHSEKIHNRPSISERRAAEAFAHDLKDWELQQN